MTHTNKIDRPYMQVEEIVPEGVIRLVTLTLLESCFAATIQEIRRDDNAVDDLALAINKLIS
jgi:hypothetical protein